MMPAPSVGKAQAPESHQGGGWWAGAQRCQPGRWGVGVGRLAQASPSRRPQHTCTGLQAHAHGRGCVLSGSGPPAAGPSPWSTGSLGEGSWGSEGQSTPLPPTHRPPSLWDRPWAPCPGCPTFVFGVAHQQVLQQERRLDLELLHLLLHGPHQHGEAVQAQELQQPSLLLPDQAWGETNGGRNLEVTVTTITRILTTVTTININF